MCVYVCCVDIILFYFVSATEDIKCTAQTHTEAPVTQHTTPAAQPENSTSTSYAIPVAATTASVLLAVAIGTVILLILLILIVLKVKHKSLHRTAGEGNTRTDAAETEDPGYSKLLYILVYVSEM